MTGERRLIYVIGCQRSGSTLVGQVLGAHPSSVLIDENDGLYTMYPRLPGGGAVPEADPWERIVRNAQRKYRHPEERFVEVSDGIRLADSVSHVVFKAPNFTFAWKRLAEHFPGARFVAPIRDPRDVVASMLSRERIPMIRTQTRLIETLAPYRASPKAYAILRDSDAPQAVKAAAVWRIKNELCEPDDSGRIARIRYEDLVNDPEGCNEQLCGLVGLPEAGAVRHAEVMWGRLVASGVNRRRPVDIASQGRWRWVLSGTEAQEILSVAGPLAQRYGYATQQK